MAKRISIMLSVIGALALTCLGIAHAKLSTRPIGPLHIEQFGVYDAAGEISRKAGIPVGVDAILPERDLAIAFDFPGGTVADLLNALISRAPDYGWEESQNGIIHVFRKGAQVGLLDVALSYPGSQKETRRDIWRDLANRPEISQWLKSNDCVRQEFFMGHEFSTHNEPISIPAGTMTVRELFDTVALKSGSNRWLALQSPPSSSSCHVSLMLW